MNEWAVQSDLAKVDKLTTQPKVSAVCEPGRGFKILMKRLTAVPIKYTEKFSLRFNGFVDSG